MNLTLILATDHNNQWLAWTFSDAAGARKRQGTAASTDEHRRTAVI